MAPISKEKYNLTKNKNVIKYKCNICLKSCRWCNMNKKKIFLFIFWIFSIVFFECIYRMTLFNNIFDKDFMQMIIFAIPFAILMFIITNLFK